MGGESYTLGDAMPFDFGVLRADAIHAPPLESFEARDGATLGFRRFESDSPLKLILLHGSGSHGRYFAAVAGAIAASGAAEVFAPDLRGHGPNPAHRGDIDYIDQLEDDVADLIAHIRRLSSRAAGGASRAVKIILGGHSSGGGLAVRFAGSPHGAEADGFLLLAPFLKHDAPTTRANAGGWARPKPARIALLALLNGLGIRALNDRVVIEFEMPEAARDGTETLAYSYRLNTGYAPRDYRTDLAAIESAQAPLLVVIGARDEAFVPAAFADELAACAPRGRLEVLPGESHLGLVVGDALRAPVIAWLEEQRPSRDGVTREA
jgi:alpha-beta hydrolase superfamily lysophospholipase